jgi:hypothetical protein
MRQSPTAQLTPGLGSVSAFRADSALTCLTAPSNALSWSPRRFHDTPNQTVTDSVRELRAGSHRMRATSAVYAVGDLGQAASINRSGLPR